jgi:endoglucanase
MAERSLLPMLGRRSLLGSLPIYGAARAALPASGLLAADWRTFKSRFLSPDGRIIDTGNHGISHTEGQGWGLLFSVAAGDQDSFDLILNWTARTLRRPNDALHAWRYDPADKPPVRDMNNAADGDIFIATALCRAGRLWGRPDDLIAASAIAQDILRLLVRHVGPYLVLLPGVEGFETPSGVIVNPSYYVFPMMDELARVVPNRRWQRLAADGQRLIESGRFGRWALPPDWLHVNKADAAMTPAPGWPPRFSYDAVRVPLWWSWGRLPSGPAMQSLQAFWNDPPAGRIPAWVDLKSNDVAPYPAAAGMAAIVNLLRNYTGSAPNFTSGSISEATDYYNASLIMLCHLAEQANQAERI